MSSNFAMSLMTTMEFLLWATLGFLFWNKGLRGRFPAISAYLMLRVGSAPVLLGLFLAQSKSWGQNLYAAYFFAYWIVYFASAVSLFFISVEIFRSMLSPFAGLMRLGTVAFRWVALASLVVGLATVSYEHHGILIMSDIAYGLMRSVSVLELCLLGFLCLSMNALSSSPRELGFGFALGFGIMSTSDFVVASLLSRFTSLTSPLEFIYQSIVLGVLGIWIAYCAMPEPARKPVVLPANSTIYRWNEIAAALGHGTKVAVQQPANSFFLSDVEKVVDKVLTRANMQGNESK